MENINIDFYKYDTSQLEMLLESNMIEFKKEISSDKTTLILTKEVARMLFLNFGHMFDMFLMSLEEDQQIKIGDKNIQTFEDFKEFI